VLNAHFLTSLLNSFGNSTVILLNVKGSLLLFRLRNFVFSSWASRSSSRPLGNRNSISYCDFNSGRDAPDLYFFSFPFPPSSSSVVVVAS